jgi:hypothetical protein
LKSDGLPADDLHTKEFDDRLDLATMEAQVKYGLNPSKFCNAAWQLAGPDGMYHR